MTFSLAPGTTFRPQAGHYHTFKLPPKMCGGASTSGCLSSNQPAHRGCAAGAVGLIIFSAIMLIRWRVWALIIGIVLRPDEPAAGLIDLPDGEARRLARFLSATILAGCGKTQ